jgi:hypothetical protein
VKQTPGVDWGRVVTISDRFHRVKTTESLVVHALEGSIHVHYAGFDGCEWGVIDGEEDVLYLYKTESEARQAIAAYEGRNLLR